MMDYTNLTIGEIAAVEELSGIGLQQMEEPSTPKAKLMAAVAFVTVKRAQPKVKFGEFLAMTIDELTEAVEAAEAAADEADAPDGGGVSAKKSG